MKKRALLLSFVGATVLTLGLQSQQTFASTYGARLKNNYPYRNSNKKWSQNFERNYYFNTDCGEFVQTPKPEPTPKPEQKPETSPDVSINNFETKVVELTNVERAKQGLPALKLDESLSKVAKLKSQDIYEKNYFDHNSPTYGSPFDMMKKFGISYRSAGENIAKGQRTPEEVVNAWMNSPGHRQNILGSYTHIGVGYVSSGNVWTQMFISK